MPATWKSWRRPTWTRSLLDLSITIWRFPKLGVPPNHPFKWDFPWFTKPFWDTPILGVLCVSPCPSIRPKSQGLKPHSPLFESLFWATGNPGNPGPEPTKPGCQVHACLNLNLPTAMDRNRRGNRRNTWFWLGKMMLFLWRSPWPSP